MYIMTKHDIEFFFFFFLMKQEKGGEKKRQEGKNFKRAKIKFLLPGFQIKGRL